MPRIYDSPGYAMGDEALVAAAANAPVTPTQAAQAKAELARMRRSLASWLHYRAINDRTATGHVAPALLRRPGTTPAPAPVLALRLRRDRAAREQGMADDLHALLSEVFDASQLPSPDLAKDPDAAAKLAAIAVAGKLPGDATSATPQGFIWLWPLVVVVGAIAFAFAIKVRSDADVAKEHEKYQCIQSGACTDSGFWLKVGGAGFIGWLLWSRFGHHVTGRKKGAR